jgi:dinuclear metal center YbgI/SA1388 family protein
MKVRDILSRIDSIVPLKLAQSWDNVGLLVGDADQSVSTILVTIDITAAVLAEAIRSRAQMILSYHPIIWDALKTVTAAGPGSVVHELVRRNLSVISIHTAYDTVVGGMNDQLAHILDLQDAKPLGDYVEAPSGPLYKLVTFVPADAVNRVADAIFAAGAGAVGRYSHCGFQTPGTGSFLPLEGSRPAVGRKGKLEKVSEIRLESIVPTDRVPAVLAALRKAHPYETPAFDLLRHHDLESRWGLGRMGTLPEPLSLDRVIAKVKRATGARTVGIVGPAKRQVRTAAVCAGACGKLLNQVIAAGCDLYLTGELKHHQAIAAQEAGLTCLCLSHTVSERFALKKLARSLQKQLPDAKIVLSRADADPFTWKPI